MQEKPILTLTQTAVGAVTGDRFVTPVCVRAVEGEAVLGVAKSDAANTELFPVVVLGTVIVEAGAAFAKGVQLMSDAQGRGIPWTAGNAVAGISQQEATAAGQRVEVLVGPSPDTSAVNIAFTHTATDAVVAHRFVTPAGAVATAGAATLGVASQAADAAAKFNCVVAGLAWVTAGAQVAANATLMSDATGRGITWTANNAKTAIALSAAAQAGALIPVIVLPNTLPATVLSALTMPMTAGAGGLTAKRFVKADGTKAGAGDNTVGVALETAVQGASATVAIVGLAQVTAGGEVAVSAVLKSDADGKAVTWAVSGAKSAIALTAAAAEDDDIWVLLVPNV